MKNYQIGDRVKVYATLNGVCAETPGEIVGARLTDGMIRVKLDGRRGEIIAHPKQCRRLVKKKRRSVWIKYINPLDPSAICAWSSKPEVIEAIEFVEVKRRGT